MKKISKEIVRASSLDEQLHLVKTFRPRTLIYLRGYTQFKEVRRKAQFRISLIWLLWMGVIMILWWANNH